jgi:hypothetical protein
LAQGASFDAQSGARQNEEETMLVTEFTSLIQAIAALIYATAKLVRNFRRHREANSAGVGHDCGYRRPRPITKFCGRAPHQIGVDYLLQTGFRFATKQE